MNTRTAAATALTALALTLTACSSDSDSNESSAAPSNQATPPPTTAAPAGARHYDSAQDIADALKAAGLKASKPQKDAEKSYITEVGGTSYTFTVTDENHDGGETLINMFPNPEALAAWVPLSKQFGGVAVTDDTWAVSLPTKAEGARDSSKRIAPKIAAALDGTVQQ
ncbi:hypothetical protein [Streptomyces sp. STCH 565 A]|uniref:hypothetical protein n=1 Tax=Streptomyces sp. STCH 565 A TaxID=2950532 RepID=UPI0020753FC4|nr:hypothetical protein [Streptomyces sp. STCH 565 A]MCM8550053.1 hypothetical protein [Streptomyces sp. STCH 565 A]